MVRVVSVVGVVMVLGRKSGRAGKHHQEQSDCKEPLHRVHPNKIELAAEAPHRASYPKSNEESQGR